MSFDRSAQVQNRHLGHPRELVARRPFGVVGTASKRVCRTHGACFISFPDPSAYALG